MPMVLSGGKVCQYVGQELSREMPMWEVYLHLMSLMLSAWWRPGFQPPVDISDSTPPVKEALPA